MKGDAMTQLKLKREVALKDYLIVVAHLPRVGAAERTAWMAQWQAGDAEAGRLLLESFLALVVAEAAARRGLGARFEALLAVGNRALAKALTQACAAGQLEHLDATARHAVIGALKAFWIKAAVKGA
jgi:DNA-directed RNA polymerase sigma subunit (sigma70/sigma32)